MKKGRLICVAAAIVVFVPLVAAESGTRAANRIERLFPFLSVAIDAVRPSRGIDFLLVRRYPSSAPAQNRRGAFGYGWIDSLTIRAERRYPDGLVIPLLSGRTLSFRDVKGKWLNENPFDATTLEESSVAYVATFEDGTVQSFDKESGRTSFIKDNKGNTLTFLWDGEKLVRVSHIDGQSLSFAYAGGLISAATDECGRRTEYSYSDGYLASVKTYDGLTTRYEYGIAGTNSTRSLTKILRHDGTTREFSYSADGCISSMTENGGNRPIGFEQLSGGTVVVTAPDGGRTRLDFGGADELALTTDALGNAMRCEYGTNGLPATIVSPSGRRTAMEYDVRGRIRSIVSPSGATIRFDYAGEYGKLSRVADARSQAVSFDFDSAGRTVSAGFPDGSSSKISYNARGDAERIVNRRGGAVERIYDTRGRIVRQTWPDGRTFTYAYDARGNAVIASDSETGAIRMSYDAADRLAKVEYPGGRGFDFKYDSAGRLASRTASDGFAERFSYDAESRLASVSDKNGNVYLRNEYDERTGRIAKQTYGNGASVMYGYDLLGRIVSIAHADADGKELEKFSYIYDADGKCQASLSKSGWETYAYDSDGQLTAAFYPGGTKDSFTYDATGNRTSVNGVCCKINALNEYTSVGDGTNAISFAYDLDGNLVSQSSSSGATVYCYDVLNRLVAVTNEAADIRWSCKYDALGNRISVTYNGAAVERLFHPGPFSSVAAEYVDGKLAKRHIVVGALQITEIADDGSIHYLHGDLVGSVRLVTDGKGRAVFRTSYSAFGLPRECSASSHLVSQGYVGMLGVETDPTGLLFMRNRYYSPGLGRFITPDPIGFNGGDVNWYRYCGNDPVISVDPDGLTGFVFSSNPFLESSCHEQNIERARMNLDGPSTLSELVKNYSKQYEMRSSWESLLHNQREWCGFSGETRIICGIGATAEYGLIKILPSMRDNWPGLFYDTAEPNVKFTEINGPGEHVYNLQSGNEVTSGVNQGTANYHREDVKHGIVDVLPYFPCGTPSEQEKKEAEKKGSLYRRKHSNRGKSPEQRHQATNNSKSIDEDEDRDLSSDEIPDPDNDDYVWCEDVCGEEGLKPVCPKDTENAVYWGCSRCGHVIRKKARKAKRFERSLKAQGREGRWHGTQLDIRQAKSADEKDI